MLTIGSTFPYLFPIFALSLTPDFHFCPASQRNSAYHESAPSMSAFDIQFDRLEMQCGKPSKLSVARCYFGCRCGDNARHVWARWVVPFMLDMEHAARTSQTLTCYKLLVGWCNRLVLRVILQTKIPTSASTCDANCASLQSWVR